MPEKAPASFLSGAAGSRPLPTNSGQRGWTATSQDAALPGAAEIARIFDATLRAVEDGHRRLSELVQVVRSEYERACSALEQVKQEVLRQVEQVDDLEAKSRVARFDLFRVSRDFQNHTEQDVRQAYEAAERIQILLGEARERERFLKERRAELERTVARLGDLVRQAETTETNMRAALQALHGHYSGVSESLGSWQARQELSRRIITAQEEERRRLARELHDGTAQSLAGIAVELELAERMVDGGPEGVRRQLDRLRTLVKESLTEVRRVISDLRPMALDELGVISAVRRHADRLSALGGPPIEVVVHGPERRFDPAMEVAAFRVIQEAIHNARRHAGASHIWVYMEVGGTYLNVTVRDDGRGFDVERVREEARQRGSIGLISMEERVKLFGGRFSIHSTPGHGSRVVARFPVEATPPADPSKVG
ncbi:histidine kinase [Carboxydochorda subterranea]|uniref:histidine kinase n=1 Tax=Carboxydichorda subterranea TaxID=3109565 RepID=A0ABZ1BYS1_9FIRM|nr:histidine kinase [Limnochorda sp. L945t]WRP17871.1 histidine kinase [Limnochorda sp. L945t]